MRASAFIKTAHPKKEIKVDISAFRRILEEGWWGQCKIHGHRAQIHLSANPAEKCLAFNRHDQLHAKELDTEIITELRRILDLQKGWSAIEAEWLKPEKKLFLFDYIKANDVILATLGYEERYQLLPRAYLSPHIATLAVLRTAEDCMAVIRDPAAHIEGLLFKSRFSQGFSNHSMIRCRKSATRLQ